MQLDNAPNNRQTESGTCQRDIAARRSATAFEALENARQIILSNAAARYRDGQLDRISLSVARVLRRVPCRRSM